MKGVSGVEPHEVDGVGRRPTRDTPRLGRGVTEGIALGWTSGTLKRTEMGGLCYGWCFSCLIDKNLSRMGMGPRNKSRQEIYVR